MLTTRVDERWNRVTSAPLEWRSCAMSWPLLPVPITMARLPFQFSPSSYPLECTTLPAKSFRPEISGTFGMPLTPVASTTWRGRMMRLPPSARRSVTVQRPSVSS
jgi:hypothetical protein